MQKRVPGGFFRILLETSGFGTAVYRYWKRGLADMGAVRTLVVITMPVGIAGAIAAHYAPTGVLRIGYGVAMIVVAVVLYSGHSSGRRPQNEACPCIVCESECSFRECSEQDRKKVESSDGEIFEYCAVGMPGQRMFSGVGAFLTGLISTGVGEATLPFLARRSRFPVPVAAATSTMVVAATVLGAAYTHLIQLASSGGFPPFPGTLLSGAYRAPSSAQSLVRPFKGKSVKRLREGSSLFCSFQSESRF